MITRTPELSPGWVHRPPIPITDNCTASHHLDEVRRRARQHQCRRGDDGNGDQARSPTCQRRGVALTGTDLTDRALTGRALTGRALTGRALTGRALTGRALTGRALSSRVGALAALLASTSPPVLGERVVSRVPAGSPYPCGLFKQTLCSKAHSPGKISAITSFQRSARMARMSGAGRCEACHHRCACSQMCTRPC